MKIKKVGKKVELNVSAQHNCLRDCRIYVAWSSTAYKAGNRNCRVRYTSRWTIMFQSP